MFIKILLFFSLFIVPLSLNANDACGWTTDETISLDSSNTVDHFSGTVNNSYYSRDTYDYAYIKVNEPGTVTIEFLSGSANADFRIDMNGCTTYAYDWRKNDLTIDVSGSDQDFNLIVRTYNSSYVSYNFKLTFKPAVATANDDELTTISGYQEQINLLSNDSGDAIKIISHTTPAKGEILDLNYETGNLIYKADDDIYDTSFKYEIEDSKGNQSEATVTIHVVEKIIEDHFRDFKLRKQLYLKGNIKTIGNTVVVPPDIQTSTICNTYTNGGYQENVPNRNDYYYQCGYQIESGTTNSTMSELQIPGTATVVWAGLYWQSIVGQNDFNTNMSIKFKKQGSVEYTVIPAILNYADSQFNTDNYQDAISYSAFSDVTSMFTDNNWNSGFYIASNIPVHEGKVTGLGNYGAWTLVVVYEDSKSSTEKFRSFSIYDGWKSVTTSDLDGDGTADNNVPITVLGFYTPDKTNINSTVSIFAAEGDKNILGDYLKTYNYNASPISEVTLPNSTVSHTFNSSISGGWSREPELINNNGIDIQTFDIGDYLAPQQSQMDFRFTSTQDQYYPSMIAFQTELVAPQVCYDYAYKQNGIYLTESITSTTHEPRINGYIDTSTIEASIYLRSTDSDFDIQGISLYTDMNSTQTGLFSYVTNSAYITETNSPTYKKITTESSSGCNYSDPANSNRSCTTDGNVRIGMGTGATGYSMSSAGALSAEEYMYTKFKIKPSISGQVDEPLDLKVDYYIIPPVVGAEKIPFLGKKLGEDIPLCPPSNAYVPAWGQFNVIDRNLNATRSTFVNNLYTQISQKPFNVDLAVYEKDAVSGEFTKTPTFDLNTTVQVEIIDADAFHDLNASCTHPESNVSKPIFVNSITKSSASASPTNKTQIFTPSADYYNFAVKNAAFRIWYFHDGNQSLVQNWTAATSDNINLLSIAGLYDATKHTLCATACNPSTTTTCFTCMKENYASPLCSRDNFSVRPEALQLSISDNGITHALPAVNLSQTYQYLPDTTKATGNIDLAAGYEYRFDFNATNHFDLNPTPGYTQRFSIAGETNASLLFEPSPATLANPTFNAANCNDTTNMQLENAIGEGPWFKNGVQSNFLSMLSNAGEYRIDLNDQGWTAVDFDSSKMVHHIIKPNFLSGTDCQTNSSRTNTAANPLVGCNITSNHVNDDIAMTQNGTTYIYEDHNVTFKPYRFDLSRLNPTIGFGGASFDGNKHYLYMNDINKTWAADNNASSYMAVSFIGTVDAVGADDVLLNNYVTGCYAKDLNISAISSYLTPPFDGANDFTADANSTNDLNLTRYLRVKNSSGIPSMAMVPATRIATTQNDILSAASFYKGLLGKANIGYFINYNRQIIRPGGSPAYMQSNNPAAKNFADFNVTCAVTANNSCLINADTTIRDYNGTIDLQDTPVNFLYARTFVPSQTYRTDVGTLDITYEVFCAACASDATLAGLLASAPNMTASYNAGWYTNTDHDLSLDGNVSQAALSASFPTHRIVEQSASNVFEASFNEASFAAGKQPASIQYNGMSGYPYTTTMIYQPSLWLIYDKYDTTATTNFFSATFNGGVGQWTGQGVDNAGKTDSNASGDTSRRIRW